MIHTFNKGDVVAQQLKRSWDFAWTTVANVTATQVVLADGNRWRKPGTRGTNKYSYRLVGEQEARYGASNLSQLMTGEQALKSLLNSLMAETYRQAGRSTSGEAAADALKRLVDVLAKGGALVREGAEKIGDVAVLELAEKLEKLAETQG